MQTIETSPVREVSLGLVSLVSKSPSAHLPSTWRPPIGKYLTNRIIHEYALVGKYGPSAQKHARAVELFKHDLSLCPECGKQKRGVRHRMYDYLPHYGKYCLDCVEAYRRDFRKDQQLKKLVKVAKERFILDNYA